MELKIPILILNFLLISTSFCLHPIIFVPGNGGSKLMAKLDKVTSRHSWCEKTTDDFFVLWPNIENYYPKNLECFVENMRLHYDNETRKTTNTPGVEIIVPGFGDTDNVEHAPSSYFYGETISYFVKNGYQRGKDIRGAPYDFRKAPSELGEFYANLETLVEDTYVQNGNKKVVLIGHSQGCLTTLYFLNQLSQTWKNKYIKSFVPIVGAFGGGGLGLQMFISGLDYGFDFLDALVLREQQRSNPATAMYSPSNKSWNSSQVLVRTDKRMYTVEDYKDLFHDIGYPAGYEMWKDAKNIVDNLRSPGVEIHCLYGTGIPTAESFTYGSDFPNSKPNVTYGDGDGVVNTISLEACRRWKEDQEQKMVEKVYKNVDHFEIMRNPETLEYILQISK